MIRDVWFEVAMKLVAVILVAVPGMLSCRVFPVFHAVRTSVRAACIRPGRCGLGFPWEAQNPKTSLLMNYSFRRGFSYRLGMLQQLAHMSARQHFAGA